MERDDIVVTYDASETSIDEILQACKDSGFPATVATEPTAEPEKNVEAGEDPEFFLAALATAKREGKLLVLDFSAEWCAPCQRMIREVFPDPKVAVLLESFVFLTIDTDAYPALAQKYRVVGMPDIRILSPDGKEIRQLLGFHDAESFAAALQASLEFSGSVGAVTGGTAPIE